MLKLLSVLIKNKLIIEIILMNKICLKNNKIFYKFVFSQVHDFRMKVNLRHLVAQLRSEIVSTLIDSTYSCRIFCLVLTLFYAINLITSSYDFELERIFGVTPGYLIPPNFWIWTLVSHAFIESTLFFLVTGYTVILGSSRLLEPLWGQLEFGIFFGKF